MSRKSQRTGLTLVELLVVIAILALLAGLILAKMGGILERSQSAVQAANIHDSSRFIETYYALHKTYPDGWDTLIEGAGGSSTLYTSLSPQLTTMLTVQTLTTEQLQTLRNIGINHIKLHSATHPFPSDSAGLNIGVGAHLIGHSGSADQGSLATLDKSNPAVDNLLRADFNLPNSSSGGGFYDTHTFVVFGFGPQNWMVSEVVQVAPLLESIDAGNFYARALAVFAVPNTATGIERASFIGVFGPDGRSLRSSAADYNKQAPRDH